MRPGNPGHRWHGTVRLHARPVHQERPGLRGGLQPDQPPDVPGHPHHEGADRAGEGLGEGPAPAGGEQGGPGAPSRGDHQRRGQPGPGVELPVPGGVGQEQVQRERGVRRDRAGNELQPGEG